MPTEPQSPEEEFDEPPSGSSKGEGIEEEAEDTWDDPSDLEENAAASEASPDGHMDVFGEDLVQAHAQVEQFLGQQTQAAVGAEVMAEDAFDGAGNVVGVGLGVADDPLLGDEPGAGCLNLYVVEPCSQDEARAAMFDSMSIAAASSEKLPVNVIVTGLIEAQPHRFKIRPAPGGVSCGHVRVTAGTLGCLASGRRAPRNRRRLILSNNHVLANSNNARFGDSIIQPGRADGGRSPRDRIAILERFVPINFAGGVNFVDCATGWAWPKRVRPELVFVRGGRRRFFRISNRLVGCRRGQLVGKSGRTTQLTNGRVTDCNATIRVSYGRAGTALFRDQITIRGQSGLFSQGGDSGSVIWTWDRRRNPVGLLFAGGGGFTFANKIGRVLQALDINLVT